ncbi:MAG: D-2-hydroxyacid dehydrogenase [Chloroflexi bacterium]|nr:D-2-hydroxyacid dehydrogenase [Chloroflexota bacterium]MDA1146142.1 D-2-hydroxyacid dehydrogenase [Chloroflexota bacterium]
MSVLLITPELYERYAGAIAAMDGGERVEPVFVPAPGERVPAADLERVEIATPPIPEEDPSGSRRFYGSATRAPNLRWVHLPHVGIDDDVFGRLLAGGVRLTNVSGAMAEPIAWSAIGGLLQLARGFPRWAEAQREREWSRHPHGAEPADLRGQTAVIVGLGAIGSEIARLAQALHLQVIAVRRSPRRADDPVDELVPPERLAEVLPRADWLILAAPLTPQTRGLIDATALDLLPPGARIVNIARGQIIDEASMIERLADGRIGGAYLDVFEEEPLPVVSPLWALPNVIVTPHNSESVAAAHRRLDGYFLRNLQHWLRDEPLENEVSER